MFIRLTLATATSALLLTGCASQHAASDAQDAFSGPTLIHVTHKLTRIDDGSRIFLTIDGQDAGLLPAGESRDIHVSAGKHQVGGYVSTLFNYGKVTVTPVEVTTHRRSIQNVDYAVSNMQSGFKLTGSTPVPPPAPVVAPSTSQPLPETPASITVPVVSATPVEQQPTVPASASASATTPTVTPPAAPQSSEAAPAPVTAPAAAPQASEALPAPVTAPSTTPPVAPKTSGSAPAPEKNTTAAPPTTDAPGSAAASQH